MVEKMDICDDCEVNPATVHLTHVESNESQTFHLCEDCARRRGVPIPDGEALIKGLEAIAGVAGTALGETHVKVTVKQAKDEGKDEEAAAEESAPDVTCPNCGMKLSEFRTGGWLGCAECYNSFEERIDRILMQVHGAGGHKGKAYGRPVSVRRSGKRDVARLRRELDDAIKNERFEQAAVIRDAIIGLKSGER